MPEDLMRYDILAQQALRGVVRAALRSVERSGLPGEHHFYIAFDTGHPGTKVSDRLKRKYPEEMTIVLQHQFWGLDVGDDGFRVELSFDNIPEKMEIPFAAVKGFFDPHVQFGLQFEMDEANQNLAEEEAKAAAEQSKGAEKSKVTDDESGSEPEEDAEAVEEAAEPAVKIASKEPAEAADEEIGEETGEEEKVVSLDAFRKK
ncbi:MAG: SspB family protein [Hyphomicrobiales bacterium]